MAALHTSANAIYLMQILVAAPPPPRPPPSRSATLPARPGHLDWPTGQFAKSPLAGIVPVLLIAITILELAAGALSAVGCVLVILLHDSTIAFYGAVVAAVAVLALFFGQRMAKDYPGAAVLVSYFLVAIVAIYLLAPR